MTVKHNLKIISSVANLRKRNYHALELLSEIMELQLVSKIIFYGEV